MVAWGVAVLPLAAWGGVGGGRMGRRWAAWCAVVRALRCWVVLRRGMATPITVWGHGVGWRCGVGWRRGMGWGGEAAWGGDAVSGGVAAGGGAAWRSGRVGWRGDVGWCRGMGAASRGGSPFFPPNLKRALWTVLRFSRFSLMGALDRFGRHWVLLMGALARFAPLT